MTMMPGGHDWRIDDEFAYTASDGTKITVPGGTITDGASIPRLFWRMIGGPMTGKFRRAAVVHDYLYSTHKLSREKSDWIFLDAMRTDGVSWWKRRAMWAAVRSFGEIPWDDKPKGFKRYDG
jgi:hypothetical protein